MPRKVTKKLQRQLQPDRRYQSVLVQRLINKSMLDGKKLAAERAVYTASTCQSLSPVSLRPFLSSSHSSPALVPLKS